jgi:hypothetical protein
MKKVGLAFLFLFGFVGLCKAEIMVSSKEEPVLVTFSTSTLVSGTSAQFILVSLPSVYGASGSSFSHINNGGINLVTLNIVIDKVAASSGTLKIGVLTEVNAATGSVKYFATVPFSRDTTSTFIQYSPDYNHFFARCKVAYNGRTNGVTPFITSNDVAVNQTAFRRDNILQSPIGTIAPHVGDVVMVVTTNAYPASPANAIDVSVTSLYNSEYK